MSDPYQRRDLSNCGAGRLHVAINCGVLSGKQGRRRWLCQILLSDMPPFSGLVLRMLTIIAARLTLKVTKILRVR